jgi:hypothetical protein
MDPSAWAREAFLSGHEPLVLVGRRITSLLLKWMDRQQRSFAQVFDSRERWIVLGMHDRKVTEVGAPWVCAVGWHWTSSWHHWNLLRPRLHPRRQSTRGPRSSLASFCTYSSCFHHRGWTNRHILGQVWHLQYSDWSLVQPNGRNLGLVHRIQQTRRSVSPPWRAAPELQIDLASIEFSSLQSSCTDRNWAPHSPLEARSLHCSARYRCQGSCWQLRWKCPCRHL